MTEIGILAMESSRVLKRINLSRASDSLVVEWGSESLPPHRGVERASETACKADAAANSQCLVNVTIMVLAVACFRYLFENLLRCCPSVQQIPPRAAFLRWYCE